MKFVSLNLVTANKNQEKIKQYLEENASDALVEKINKGVEVKVKDDDGEHIVINKKTLNGFMEYARGEAKKQSTGPYAMIDDEVVFGWAVHYFEEESIHEKLYNPYGTVYVKKEKKKDEKKATPSKNSETKKEKTTETKKGAPVQDREISQMSLFDFGNDNENMEETKDED